MDNKAPIHSGNINSKVPITDKKSKIHRKNQNNYNGMNYIYIYIYIYIHKQIGITFP